MTNRIASSGGMRRPKTPGGWMDSIDFLRSREERIEARIRDEESITGRTSKRPSDRRARLDALAVVRRRIGELEAAQDIPPHPPVNSEDRRR